MITDMKLFELMTEFREFINLRLHRNWLGIFFTNIADAVETGLNFSSADCKVHRAIIGMNDCISYR